MGVELPKASTHLKMLEKLQELFPEMVEGVQWDLTEGGFRNVFDFLANLRVAELTKIFDDENLPLTHGVMWSELDRNYRCFRQQDVEVSIFELLDCLTDDEQVTLLTPVDYCNIIRNMSLHETRRTNFVLSEILIWTKYLQFALQKMYEVAGEIDDEKEAVKEDLAVAEAKLASTDNELAEAHEEVSRVRHELQLLQQQVTDLNTRAEQIKTSHIEALKEADERSRNLERTKAESDRSLKAEINRLSRQLAMRESSNTPMSAMTRSLPAVGSTNQRGRDNDDSSERLESSHTTPQRGRLDQRSTSGASDAQRDRPSTLVHSIAHEAKYLKGAGITRDEVSKFVSFLERYDGNGEYMQGGVSKFIDTAATKTITMKLRKTQVGQELLRMSNWIPQDSWRDMWSVQDIIAGLKEAYVRPSAQLYAEIDDIWDKRLDDFEKTATVDPLRLTESVEVKLIHQMLEFTTTQAPPSKEMELKCLERFETILTGKRNPKRFNDTHKKFQLALNVYLGRRIGTCCSTIIMMCCMIGNVRFSH